ncbi:hypothetical protein QTP70_030359, partial [Hemibagrus guttatus]
TVILTSSPLRTCLIHPDALLLLGVSSLLLKMDHMTSLELHESYARLTDALAVFQVFINEVFKD